MALVNLREVIVRVSMWPLADPGQPAFRRGAGLDALERELARDGLRLHEILETRRYEGEMGPQLAYRVVAGEEAKVVEGWAWG